MAPGGLVSRFSCRPPPKSWRTAGRPAVHRQRLARGVVSLPDRGRPVVEIAGIAGRREVEAAVGHRRVDALGDDAVLQDPLAVVEHVVDDDVRPRRAQRLDVDRELRLAGLRRREVQVGPRREVVDDLEHRRSLVAPARLSGEHRDPLRQVSGPLPPRQAVHPVREHADPDAGAVDAVDQARQVRAVGDVALRRVDLAPHGGGRRPPVDRSKARRLVRDRLVGGANRPDRIHLGERLDGGERQSRPDGPVARHAVDDVAAQGPDAGQHLGRHLGPDVDRRPPVRCGAAERRVARHPGPDVEPGPDVDRRALVQHGSGVPRPRVGREPVARRRLPRAGRRVQQLRAHLPLRRRPLRLRGQQRRDLRPGARRERRRSCRRVLGGRGGAGGGPCCGGARSGGRPDHAGPGRRTLRVRRPRRRLGQGARGVGPAMEAEAPPARRLPALVQRRRDPQQAHPRLDAAATGHRSGRRRGRPREVAGAARRHRGRDRRQQGARDPRAPRPHPGPGRDPARGIGAARPRRGGGGFREERLSCRATGNPADPSIRRAEGDGVDTHRHAGTVYGRRNKTDELRGRAGAKQSRSVIPGSHLRSASPRLHGLASGDHPQPTRHLLGPGHDPGRTANLWIMSP